MVARYVPDVVCGLDFGTSNSTLALMRDAKPFLVPLERGRDTIPSAIFYSFEDDTTLFGQAAIGEYVRGAKGRLMRSLKSILGTALMDERTLLRKRSVPFTISLDTIMPLLGAGTRMRGRDLPVPIWLYNDLATWHKINGLYMNQVRALVRQIMQEAAQPALIERLLRVLEQRRGHVLLGCAEAAKIKLSNAEAVSLPLAAIGDDLALDISSRRLRSILKGWVEALDSAMSRTLDLGQVQAGDIGTVFLTGGTTLSPIVRDLVGRVFPDATIASGDNFGAVGLGLALDAARRFGL